MSDIRAQGSQQHFVPIPIPDRFYDINGVTITTITTVATPTTGTRLRPLTVTISVSAACSVLFEDNAAGAGNFVFRTPKLLADTPYTFDLGRGKLLTGVLKATSSAAAALTGTVAGTEENI